MNLNIEYDAVIICEDSLKNELVFGADFSQNHKYFTRSAFIKNVLFSYDDEAINYLMKTYALSYDLAKESLDNLLFINENTTPINQKIATLKSYYLSLKQNNLLKINYYFYQLIKGKKIYIINYPPCDQELMLSLKKIRASYQYLEINQETYHHDILLFNNINQEVSFVFNQIAKLYNEGVALNDIVFYPYPREYDFVIKAFASLYQLPLEDNALNTLNSMPLFKRYIELLNDHSFQEALDELSLVNDEYHILTKLVSLLNSIDLLDISFEEKVSYLIEKAKHVYVNKSPLKECIRFVDTSYRGNKHIFIFGFSLENYPRIHKDVEFLTDEEKTSLEMNTTLIKNKIEHDKIKSFIENNPNIYLTYKEKYQGKEQYKTLLSEELQMKYLPYQDDHIRYDSKLHHLEIAYYQDNYLKYGINNPYLNEQLLHEIKYNTYDHQFKSSPLFKINKDLTFSYSSLSNYFSCPFKYLIANVCYADVTEENFNLLLGDFFHLILEDSLSKVIDFADYEEELLKKFKTEKERFFVRKLLVTLEKIIDKNNQFMEFTSFKNPHGEETYKYHIDDKTTLKGKIDKVIFDENNQECIIVDYKTGSFALDQILLPYGLKNQLLIYAFLVQDKFPSVQIDGVYIQNICEYNQDDTKIGKLKGLTLIDQNVGYHLDPRIESRSQYIDKLNFCKGSKDESKKGYNFGLGVSKEELQNYIDLTYRLIVEGIKKIRNGEFSIHPLLIKANSVPKFNSCEFCALKDVCMRDEKDVEIIQTKELKEETNGSETN